MRRLLASCLAALVVLGARPCSAGDEYERARERAKEVVEAARSKDPTALRGLAEQLEPDPWLVVDALLEAGSTDAAKAFADAYAAGDATPLRAVAGRHLVGTPDQRKALEAAEAKLAESPEADADPSALPDAAVRLLQGAEEITPGVLRVRWLECRANAHARAGRPRDESRDLRAAGEVAARMGWLRRACESLSRASDAAQRDHDFAGVLSCQQRLAALRREAGDVEGEIQALIDAAEVHDLFGERQESLDRLMEASRLAPRGIATPLVATLRARRGAALAKVGRVAEGRKELEIAVTELARAGAALDQADALVDLGSVLLDAGDPKGALKAFETAKALYDAVPEDASAEVRSAHLAGSAAVDGDLAGLLTVEGQFEAAVRVYLEDRARFQAVDDRRNAGRALQGVANVRVKQALQSGSRDRPSWLEDARTHALGAEAEAKAVGDLEGGLYARATLGEVEEALGHREEATRLFEEAVREFRSRGIVSQAIEYCVCLARVRLQAGNVGGALEAVESGLEIVDGAYGDQGSQSRVAARERHAELFRLGARAALRLPEGESLAKLFRYVEIGRASTLLDAIENRDLLRSRKVPPALERERAEAARGVVAARRAFEAVGDDRRALEGPRERLRAAQSRYEAAVDAIQAEARVTANLLYPQPLSLAAARAMLGPDQVLVLYTAVGDDAYAVVLATPSARLVPLGSAEGCRGLCRSCLKAPTKTEMAAAWSAAASKLLDPIRPLLPAARGTIYVSPDGDLGLLPFPALVKEGDPDWAFLLVPSASTLRLLMDGAPRAGKGTLAVGISDYGASAAPGAPPLRSPPLLNLDQAELEAQAIGDPALLGPKATESAFFALLAPPKAWSAIHFAVHGLLDTGNPSLSCLALTPDARDDGDLTAFELLQHDVLADVVVLAACESGGGVPIPGEGLVGLVRAFFFSGCPRVVANLWKANDDAAKVFSLAFHEAWRKPGATLSDALRAGRTAVRKDPKWAHPYYWAGWCGWGPP